MNTTPSLALRTLQPAPLRLPAAAPSKQTCFYDLPAELRIEVYRLVLDNVIIHILPLDADGLRRRCPHALVRTSRQVRAEVLPMIHGMCSIRVNVTNFNFDGLLTWISRIPPDQQANLCKNGNLTIKLCTTLNPPAYGNTLRKWLHMRADPHRPQPDWQYTGPMPKNKVASDLKRRVKRMTEEGKRGELVKMLGAIRVAMH